MQAPPAQRPGHRSGKPKALFKQIFSGNSVEVRHIFGIGGDIADRIQFEVAVLHRRVVYFYMRNLYSVTIVVSRVKPTVIKINIILKRF